MSFSKIPITQDHIDCSIPGLGEYCVLAVAMRDEGWSDVVVGENVVSGDYEGRRYRLELPKPARRLVADFDKGVKIRPRTIDLGNKEVEL